MTVDETRGVAREKDGGLRDVVGQTRPWDRLELCEALAESGGFLIRNLARKAGRFPENAGHDRTGC